MTRKDSSVVVIGILMVLQSSLVTESLDAENADLKTSQDNVRGILLVVKLIEASSSLRTFSVVEFGASMPALGVVIGELFGNSPLQNTKHEQWQNRDCRIQPWNND